MIFESDRIVIHLHMNIALYNGPELYNGGIIYAVLLSILFQISS